MNNPELASSDSTFSVPLKENLIDYKITQMKISTCNAKTGRNVDIVISVPRNDKCLNIFIYHFVDGTFKHTKIQIIRKFIIKTQVFVNTFKKEYAK